MSPQEQGRIPTSGEPMLNIALVQPEIPQNTGNVSRLCVGISAALHLVEPLGFRLDDRQVRRAGLDHWPDLRLYRWSSVTDLLDAHRTHRFFFATKAANRPVWHLRFNPGDFLVFGSETSGLPPDLLHHHHQSTFRLPLPGPVRSLNLANAVSAAAYEALRQFHEAGHDFGPPKRRPDGALAGHDFHVELDR